MSFNFSVLWECLPGVLTYPCDRKTFENQCAIRMSEAFEKSGIDTSTFDQLFPNRRCYKDFNHQPRHILAAQEFADWLKTKDLEFGKSVIINENRIEHLRGRRGIVFIKDGWGSTDHIDLWDGNSLKGGYLDYLDVGIELWFWEDSQ